MDHRLLIMFSFWLLMALLQMHGYGGCLEKERIALLELKAFFKSLNDSDTETIVTSWVEDKGSDCCSWKQVKCNAMTGRVMELSLNNIRKLSSYRSDDIFPILNLSLFHPFEELRYLDLSSNLFAGQDDTRAYYHGFESLKQLKILNLRLNNFKNILPYVTTLTSLTTLNLENNGIKGFIPKQGLANLINLEVLNLRLNSISGSLMALELQNLRNLTALDMSHNMINGSLADQGICKLKNLIELDISYNEIDGHLPHCLSNLSNLKALDLSSNGLSGILPSVIANLTYLEYLALSRNNFQGSFSFSSLSNLSKLEIFKLSAKNNMLGLEIENWFPTCQFKYLSLQNLNLHSIPNFLLYQHNLRLIDLSHNKLVGAFPIWLLQNNSKLERISLVNNSFSGIIHLGDSKHGLLHLDISINNFSGQLPENMGKVLPKLEFIRVFENNFEGNIPSSMGEMKRLKLLDLSSNKLSGELPRNFVTDCLSLVFLNLSNNNFYGQISPQFMNLTRLRWLYFDNNHFSGKIEDGLAKSTFLAVLDISNNKLSGEIPRWIGNFSDLQVLLMSTNLLQGNIPIQLSNLESLEFLDISENKLAGTMPSSLNISSLEHLYMQKNAISGMIPEAFFKSTNLMIVDMRDNEFSGSISDWINKKSNLRVLLLGGNHLQSDIFNQLCQLRNLSILDLSYNRLNGSIPSCLTDILSWTVGDGITYGFADGYSTTWGRVSSFVTQYNFTLTLDLFENSYTASDQQLEVKFTTKNRYESYKGDILNYMTGLDLSRNYLTGNIPSEIGYLKTTRALNLSHNFLSGSIPDSFSHLEMIESLDLSYNNLSGQIPMQLGELNFMGTFNVSYNNFSGPIPNIGQLGGFDERTYISNPNLCGLPSNKSCTSVPTLSTLPSNREEDDQSTIDMMAFYGSFATTYVTIILGLAMILWINSNWRRQWFCFVDACINLCFYWLLEHIYYR